ncbi:MAG: hypothetical protein V8R91_21535 [Butyricimonas faecihominis]
MLRNNLIVLLLAAAGLFSSCGSGNHYSLTGSLPTRYDGCLVKLTPATFFFSEEKLVQWIASKLRMVNFGLPERCRNRPSIC